MTETIPDKLPNLVLRGRIESLSDVHDSGGYLLNGHVQFFGAYHHVRFFRVNDRPADEKAEWLVQPPDDAPAVVKELFEDAQKMWDGAYSTMSIPGLPGLWVMLIFPFAD